MKILTIIGARPQFIKASIGSKILRKFHNEILVHTGQHFDNNMSKVFFDELNIPKPDYNLGISGGTHAEMTAKMMIEIEKVMIKEKPDALLVYGDTNSTLAGSIVSAKLHVPIFHVEAGNRLGDLYNPEEINRIVADHLSTLRFAATEDAYNNLLKENLSTNSFFVGNIMYDAFLEFSGNKCDFTHIVDFNDNQVDIPKNYYYMTCHREENTKDDNIIIQILKAMNELDEKTIYPVHPRNQKTVLKICNDNKFDNIILIKPVGYIESINLTKNAKKIVTDSGGLQCEAFFAGVQCVTIYDKVVWPETMVNNRNQLAKPNKDDILEKLSKKQVIDDTYKPFGDGHSVDKIVNYINEWEKNR